MTSRRAVLLALVLMLAVAAIWWLRSDQPGKTQTKSDKPGRAMPTPLVRSLRPSYPYSVIAGGAYTPGELRSALRRDPVVREHYAGFDAANAAVIRNERDRLMYVSYRKDGKIRWTNRRLQIVAGETLLSDGQNLARTRCGNRLAAQRPALAELRGPEDEHNLDAKLAMPDLTDDEVKNGVLPLAPMIVDDFAARFEGDRVPWLTAKYVPAFEGRGPAQIGAHWTGAVAESGTGDAPARSLGAGPSAMRPHAPGSYSAGSAVPITVPEGGMMPGRTGGPDMTLLLVPAPEPRSFGVVLMAGAVLLAARTRQRLTCAGRR